MKKVLGLFAFVLVSVIVMPGAGFASLNTGYQPWDCDDCRGWNGYCDNIPFCSECTNISEEEKQSYLEQCGSDEAPE
jgi:hypothetical protein